MTRISTVWAFVSPSLRISPLSRHRQPENVAQLEVEHDRIVRTPACLDESLRARLRHLGANVLRFEQLQKRIAGRDLVIDPKDAAFLWCRRPIQGAAVSEGRHISMDTACRLGNGEYDERSMAPREEVAASTKWRWGFMLRQDALAIEQDALSDVEWLARWRIQLNVRSCDEMGPNDSNVGGVKTEHCQCG